MIDRPNRRSTRLPTFDYSQSGAYFLTLCTLGRACLLSEIRKGSTELSAFGEIVEYVWQDLPNRFPNLHVDEHVVMPNHFHGIFFIGPPMTIARQDGNTLFTYPGPPVSARTRPRGTRPCSFSAVVQNFSSTTTRRINRVRSTPTKRFWQERGHDRVVRGEQELWRIREYIRSNPARWKEDPENSGHVGNTTPWPFDDQE